MSWLKRLFSRRRIYGDLSEEIREHLEEKIEELVAGGMSRREATYAARREFGNVTLTEENSRLAWRWPLLENFLMDLRFALRMLVKNAGFAAVAATALALGIGADTAMYTIVNGALSWDLGLENRDRIVIVTSTNVTRSHDWGVSYPDFRDFRSQTKSLSGLAAYQMAPVNLRKGLRLSRFSLADEVPFRIGRLSDGAGQFERPQRAPRTVFLRANVRQRFLSSRAQASVGARFHSRRRTPRRSARTYTRLSRLARPLRQRSFHHRQNGSHG